MKIVVYEYVSGGGFAGQPIPIDVLAEGFGMLRTIVSVLKAARHEVTVLLDSRISKLNVPMDVDCTVPVFQKEESRRFLKTISKINDTVYIIAPETNRTLESFVQDMEHSGAVTLNSTSGSIQKVANKALLYEMLKEEGVPVPKTVLMNLDNSLRNITQILEKELKYPLIFKPLDGVGCSGLSIIKNELEIPLAIEKIKKISSNRLFIAQEKINGEAVSVSLISTGKKTLPLSLNKQNITIASPNNDSSYDGGIVPFEHPLKHKAFALAERVVNVFSGLKGYVGVDLVLTKSSAIVMDVNPRLTTSCVGLNRVADFNFAHGLVNSVLNDQLPKKVQTKGVSCFTKFKVPTFNVEAFRKCVEIKEVVCPPFSFDGSGYSCVLVASYGNALDDASRQLEEVKKRLLGIASRGK